MILLSMVFESESCIYNCKDCVTKVLGGFLIPEIENIISVLLALLDKTIELSVDDPVQVTRKVGSETSLQL